MDERMTAEAIRSLCEGLTLVSSVLFATDLRTGDDCTLTLDLVADDAPGSKAVSIRFEGVVGLRIKDFGGGVTQILGLVVRDVSDQQWDRQVYEVSDNEHDAIFFRCREYDVVRQYTI